MHKNKNRLVRKAVTRAEVYAAIDSERAYQDSMWPEDAPADPRPLSIGEGILLIEEYHTRALIEIDSLQSIRKIAGIAVRCLENHGGSTEHAQGTLSRQEVYVKLDELCNTHKEEEDLKILVALAMIKHLMIEARAAWARERRPALKALEKIWEIAAVAVRCMEANGAPLRQAA